MTEQDPHRPALGKVWSEDPLAGDWGPGDPHKPARSEAWTEGSYGAEGGDRSRHEQDDLYHTGGIEPFNCVRQPMVRAGDTGLEICKVYSVPAFRNFNRAGLGLNCKGVSRILTGHTYDSMAGLRLDRGVLEQQGGTG